MDNLRDLQELYLLAQAYEGKSTGINTSQLELDFLAFSEACPKKSLLAHLPKMYKLEGAEPAHVQAAMTALGVMTITPLEIDFSGDFEGCTNPDLIVIASLCQLQADHAIAACAYLNPLLEQVYTKAAGIIRDYGIHEVVCGRINKKRGSLDLAEAHIFPEKFQAGKYLLSVELDTADSTIKKLSSLVQQLDGFEKNSRLAMLDNLKIEEAARAAINLRERIGSLSRYNIPESTTFSAETNSCIVRVNGSAAHNNEPHRSNNAKYSTIIYLYSPKQNRNVAVYFGKSPFASQLIKEPKESNNQESPNLMILDGNDQQNTLARLVGLEIFEISTAVLNQRMTELNAMYENASRASGQSRTRLSDSYPEFEYLMTKLKEAKTYLDEVINPKMRISYAKRIEPELLEFMVCPSTDDPVIHELLPKISWNNAIRQYHNYWEFTSKFQSSDEEGKKAMLKETLANIFFTNQQNNDVNAWLYKNAKALCESEGIRFELV